MAVDLPSDSTLIMVVLLGIRRDVERILCSLRRRTMKKPKTREAVTEHLLKTDENFRRLSTGSPN